MNKRVEIKPTEEQLGALELTKSNRVVKINAKSGCGKTSTLAVIAKNTVVPSLYLAFNKSMAAEARAKFPSHVSCMTTHGLAYGVVGHEYQNKLSRPTGAYRNVGGTGSEIAKLYKIPDYVIDAKSKLRSAFLGQIIRDTVNKFEQSAAVELGKEHIPSNYEKDIKKRFPDISIKHLKSVLHRYAKRLWEERSDIWSEVMCTHDTYLKLFQLQKVQLTQYEVVYLDEAQDSNECVLDIVLSQKHCKIVLVGDDRQAIYGWRGSVNAMQKVQCSECGLTKSFRYGQKIADIASKILQNTVNIVGNELVDSKVESSLDEIETGVSAVVYNLPYTILFRKNLTLIYEAISLIERGVSISINIDTKDFVNMLKSAQELADGNLTKVKHEDIVPYASWVEFKAEAKSDKSLLKLVSLVEQGDASRVIDVLHNYDKHGDAHVTLTTSHKAKGLEYDQVVLSDDFPSNYDKNGRFVGLSEEDENLLYVAATRAKYALNYNETVVEYLDIYGGTSKSKGLDRYVCGNKVHQFAKDYDYD